MAYRKLQAKAMRIVHGKSSTTSPRMFSLKMANAGKNIMAIPLEDTKPKSKDVLEKPRVKSPEHNAHGASL